MSTLAEIRKGDILRGSDLSAFNHLHPRDEQGQFAVKESTGGMIDPRIARSKRRRKRLKRAETRSVVAVPKKVAAPSLAELAGLRVPPVQRTRVERKRIPRGPGQVEEPTEQASGVSLDDVGFNAASKQPAGTYFGEPVYIPLTKDEADQVKAVGRLSVAAARAKWGRELLGYDIRAARAFDVEREQQGTADDLVWIAAPSAWVTEEHPKQIGALADANLLTIERIRPSGTIQMDTLHWSQVAFDSLTNRTPDEEAWRALPSFQEHKQQDRERRLKDKLTRGLTSGFNPARAESPWAGGKADVWEEAEHPRDIRSGRFAERSGAPMDPRIARRRRRRRRVTARAVAASAVTDPRVHERPTVERPALERLRVERKRVTRVRLTRTHQERLNQAVTDALGVEADIVALGPMLSVEQRQEHYQPIYAERERKFKAVQGLIDEAQADPQAMAYERRTEFIQAFLRQNGGTRSQEAEKPKEHPRPAPITAAEVAQAKHGMAVSRALHAQLKAAGAGQWTMSSMDPKVSERILADVLSEKATEAEQRVFVPASLLADLTGMIVGRGPRAASAEEAFGGSYLDPKELASLEQRAQQADDDELAYEQYKGSLRQIMLEAVADPAKRKELDRIHAKAEAGGWGIGAVAQAEEEAAYAEAVGFPAAARHVLRSAARAQSIRAQWEAIGVRAAKPMPRDYQGEMSQEERALRAAAARASALDDQPEERPAGLATSFWLRAEDVRAKEAKHKQ